MKLMPRLKNHRRLMVVAGWCFIILALLYPHYRLNEPLPVTSTFHMASMMPIFTDAPWYWLFMAISPLLYIPAALGYYSALRPVVPRLAGLSVVFFVFAAIFQCASLSRFYVIHREIGSGLTALDYAEQEQLLTIAKFLEHYFGTIFGVWAAEGLLSLALIALVCAMKVANRFPQWLMSLTFLCAIWQFVVIFRLIWPWLDGIHAWGQTLLLMPLLFVLLGGGLIFFRQPREKKLANYRKNNIKKSDPKKEAGAKKSKRRSSKKPAENVNDNR